jgi:putative Mg2+ transporter-C (MgtC) family protein
MPTTLEFLAVPTIDTLVNAAARFAVACMFGGLIGFERESVGKPAGLRTHMLVALGSALLTLLIVQEGSPGDLSRVMQGIAAGIGFIGAGTILKQQNTGQIEGLTTAASIWLTAAIGVSAGAGKLYMAAIATGCALVILKVILKAERKDDASDTTTRGRV